jgi:uncharacterized protein
MSINEWLSNESSIKYLLEAIQNNNISFVEELLETYNISPNEIIDEFTLLGFAAEKQKAEIVRLLINKGANVNLTSENPDVLTAMMSAVYGGNLEIIQILINAGADLNEIRDAGSYPLMIAAKNGREDIFNFLWSLTNQELIEPAETILASAKEKLSRKPLNGATVELFDLLRRSDSSKMKIAKAISKGADVNAYDESNHTVLMRACERFSDESIIKLILDAGADPNIGNPSPLSCAIASRHYSDDVIRLLIDKGANANHKFDSGLTLLMGSCIRNNKFGHKLCLVLLETGVDYSIKDDLGRTALAYAKGNKNTEAVRLLLEAGAVE